MRPVEVLELHSTIQGLGLVMAPGEMRTPSPE